MRASAHGLTDLGLAPADIHAIESENAKRLFPRMVGGPATVVYRQ
jgi:hypothetical protein